MSTNLNSVISKGIAEEEEKVLRPAYRQDRQIAQLIDKTDRQRQVFKGDNLGPLEDGFCYSCVCLLKSIWFVVV